MQQQLKAAKACAKLNTPNICSYFQFSQQMISIHCKRPYCTAQVWVFFVRISHRVITLKTQVFCTWFPQPVMPWSPDNVQAVKIIETNLHGKMLLLSKPILASIQFIYERHLTKISNMKQVSQGGEKIWFGPPSKI